MEKRWNVRAFREIEEILCKIHAVLGYLPGGVTPDRGFPNMTAGAVIRLARVVVKDKSIWRKIRPQLIVRVSDNLVEEIIMGLVSGKPELKLRAMAKKCVSKTFLKNKLAEVLAHAEVKEYPK